MTLVADSSVILAALLNEEQNAGWAETILASDIIATPQHIYAEVAAVLRRHTLAGDISDEEATAAYSRLMAMDFELHDYEPYAARIWQLRHTVIVKDAWFVAMAEVLDARLVTVDYRLTRAPGPRCQFLTPQPSS